MVLIIYDARLGLVIYDIRKRKMERLTQSSETELGGRISPTHSEANRTNNQIIEDYSGTDDF